MDLLLAFALLFQDKSAEDAFKKLEETIEKAKTVKVQFKNEMAGKALDSGTLLLKGGSQVHLTVKSLKSSTEKEFFLISDGTRIWRQLRTGTTERPYEAVQAPEGLTTSLKVILTRGSLNLFFAKLDKPQLSWTAESDLKGAIISEHKLEEGDKGSKILSYKLSAKGKGGALLVKVWYDPKDYRLLKRELEPAEAPGLKLVETYEEFALDTEMGDDKFKLPAGK